MSNALYKVPTAVNEPVRNYAPGSAEREELISKYKEMYNQDPIDVPMYIGGKEVRTNNKKAIHGITNSTNLIPFNLDYNNFSRFFTSKIIY